MLIFLSKPTDSPASNIADGVILCCAACLSAVVPAPGAGDDGFAFSPPVPPTANGSMAPGAVRKQLYGPVLSQLRGLMIARMAKPEVSCCASASGSACSGAATGTLHGTSGAAYQHFHSAMH